MTPVVDDNLYENGSMVYISPLKKLIVFLAIISAAAYEGFRWYYFFTAPSTLWLSLPFILCESTLVVFGSVTSYLFSLRRRERINLRLRNTVISPLTYPTVDVFIPTCSEPTEIVRETLLAAINMDYDHQKLTVCVLDDSKSPEKEAMVQEVAAITYNGTTVRYIAREKKPDVPHHAKAGNINNALMNAGTSGEIIVIFDCDMVCNPDFLQAVVPHFYKADGTVDLDCCMVQTPQSFTNIPKRDPFGQNYSIFYGPGLKGWDAANSTPCCGTNVAFTRRHLLSLTPSGMQYGSITEDFLTSLTLHSRGYKTKYLNEVLASGLAPETYSDFYKQRFRWAAGGMQIFFKNNALFKSGLTGKQKLLYFYSGFNNFLALPMALMLVLPQIFLIIKSFNSDINLGAFSTAVYLAFAIPMVVFNMLNMFIAFQEAGVKFILRSIQEAAFILPCYISAVLSVMFCRPLKFTVTPKDQNAKLKQELKYIIPNILFYILSIAGIICGIVALFQGTAAYPGMPKSGVDLSNLIPIVWISFMMWQMYPPVGAFIRLWFRRHDLEEVSAESSKEFDNKTSNNVTAPQDMV